MIQISESVFWLVCDLSYKGCTAALIFMVYYIHVRVILKGYEKYLPLVLCIIYRPLILSFMPQNFFLSFPLILQSNRPNNIIHIGKMFPCFPSQAAGIRAGCAQLVPATSPGSCADVAAVPRSSVRGRWLCQLFLGKSWLALLEHLDFSQSLFKLYCCCSSCLNFFSP